MIDPQNINPDTGLPYENYSDPSLTEIPPQPKRSNLSLEKRHFEFIAKALKEIREDDYTGASEATYNHIALQFANRCAATNPNFKRQQFLDACGVSS